MIAILNFKNGFILIPTSILLLDQKTKSEIVQLYSRITYEVTTETTAILN